VLLWFCLPLIFLPKVNLISVPGETAGLRIDDLALTIAAVLLLGSWLVAGRRRFLQLEAVMALFLALGAASVVFGGGRLFYVLRLAEYFVFFYVGYYIAPMTSLPAIAYLILGANALVMVGQSSGLIGGFTVTGYRSDVSDRVVGLTAGPWEIGLVLNLVFCIIAFQEQASRRIVRAAVVFGLSMALMILTGARIPAASLLAALAVFVTVEARKRRGEAVLEMAAIGLILLPLGAAACMVEGSLQARLTSIANAENLSLFYLVVDRLDIASVQFDSLVIPYEAAIHAGFDASWLLRIHKWVYAVNAYLAEGPLTWFVGLGPGSWGPALDGGLLRLVTENGVIGTVLFLYACLLLAKRNLTLGSAVLVFLMNMVFIDVYLSYKAMSLLFLMSGFAYRERPQLGVQAATKPASLSAEGS
jgi:hypothetical protein